MRTRSAYGACVTPALCGGWAAGTNRTRSSWKRAAAARARARWPSWTGSKVPPKIASFKERTGCDDCSRTAPVQWSGAVRERALGLLDGDGVDADFLDRTILCAARNLGDLLDHV